MFGYLSYAGNLPRGDKLDARARRAVLLGYSDTQKGYKLCDLDTRTFFMSRDVSFRESTFPFKMGKACDDELLFVPITDTAGKTLQPEPPSTTNPSNTTDPSIETHTHLTLEIHILSCKCLHILQKLQNLWRTH